MNKKTSDEGFLYIHRLGSVPAYPMTGKGAARAATIAHWKRETGPREA